MTNNSFVIVSKMLINMRDLIETTPIDVNLSISCKEIHWKTDSHTSDTMPSDWLSPTLALLSLARLRIDVTDSDTS